MCGLPRSGKSTVTAALSKKLGAPIVRRDAIRLALHGERYALAAEPMVKAMSLYMIRALFLSGHEVVIADETNYSKLARQTLQEHDWETVFYPILTERDVCIERAIQTGQPDLIPIISEMWERYEALDPTDEVLVDVTPDGTIVTKKYGSDGREDRLVNRAV